MIAIVVFSLWKTFLLQNQKPPGATEGGAGIQIVRKLYIVRENLIGRGRPRGDSVREQINGCYFRSTSWNAAVEAVAVNSLPILLANLWK